MKIIGDYKMFYLALSFTVLWILLFGYIFSLDSRIKDIRKRLDIRSNPNR